jgi:hypothetical protein
MVKDRLALQELVPRCIGLSSDRAVARCGLRHPTPVCERYLPLGEGVRWLNDIPESELALRGDG